MSRPTDAKVAHLGARTAARISKTRAPATAPEQSSRDKASTNIAASTQDSSINSTAATPPPELITASFSPFNPGATRPVLTSSTGLSAHTAASALVSSAINSTSLPTASVNAATATTTTTTAAVSLRVSPMAQPERPNMPALTPTARPWPYTLPRSLRPYAGTTFASLYGASSLGEEGEGEGEGENKEEAKVGILQALLYGVPDPQPFCMRAKKEKGKGDGGTL